MDWFEGILKDYPHFKGEHGALILGDSRDVLKRIPSGVIDSGNRGEDGKKDGIIKEDCVRIYW